MNKKDLVEGLLFAGLRTLSTGCILAGLLGIALQLLDSWYRFDPNYLGAFLAETVIRPLVLAGGGLLLHLLAPVLARSMAARFNRS